MAERTSEQVNVQTVAASEVDLESAENRVVICRRCSKKKVCIYVLFSILVVYSITMTVAMPIVHHAAAQAQCDRTKILNPGACVGGWPSFPNASALAADPWGRYFEKVYGEVPNNDEDYPLCIGDLRMFYRRVLDSLSPRPIVPASVGQCPTDCGMMQMQRYDRNNMFSPPDVFWSWHPPPFHAIPNETWVEVIHRSDPFGDEKKGAWMFQAKGSGIWFNLGRSLAFVGNFKNGHDDAMKYFDVDNQPCSNETWQRRQECLSITAAAQGWDSLQFLGHGDDWEWTGTDSGTCSNTGGVPPFNIEIVAVRGEGTYACMTANGTGLGLKKGWNAAGEKCICDNSKSDLNCQGLTATQSLSV